MTNPLGRSVSYSDVFDPNLLYPIARTQSRMSLGIREPLPFQGTDRWTCYELSWLNRDGIPQIGIMTLEYPAHSPMIVESKSLKLFLGSMNFTRFDSVESVTNALRESLSSVLQTDDVSIAISSPESWGRLLVHELTGESVDNEKPQREGSPRLKSGEGEVREVLTSNLLRSLCPVTSQPDWGTLVISYTGRPLERASLLTYLIAHRSYQGFHEECCERIFTDLLSTCAPSKLWVGCFYTRRGGIDINPERWLPASERVVVKGRLARQ
jgi:7-cyano-7-deazaguanine reductase